MPKATRFTAHFNLSTYRWMNERVTRTCSISLVSYFLFESSKCAPIYSLTFDVLSCISSCILVFGLSPHRILMSMEKSINRKLMSFPIYQRLRGKTTFWLDWIGCSFVPWKIIKSQRHTHPCFGHSQLLFQIAPPSSVCCDVYLQ